MADAERPGEFIVFEIVGNGFLYNMVRIIVGTLVQVAVGEEIEARVVESGRLVVGEPVVLS